MVSLDNFEGSALNKETPPGSLISSRLPSHAGNLLEVHEFLCCFQKVLGLEVPISFEEFENELLCSWPSGIGKSAIPVTGETDCSRFVSNISTNVYCAVLPELVSKLLDTMASVVRMKLEMLPINELTWPEVVRRYIIAYLLMEGRIDSLENAALNETKLVRCLQDDGGVCYGSPTGVTGVDLDAQLLGRAMEKVSGKLIKERNMNMPDDECCIPEWAIVLDPVKKLPTNVGSRIRNCVREALKKNPPEWAKKQLQDSISKDVYKGNASGPTKRAVIDVLKRVSDVAQIASERTLPFDTDIRKSDLISKVIIKKCRSILRHVATYDINRDFCDLVGRNFNSDVDEFKVVFGTASRRPLDLRTIDLRLLHGTYGGSHEAFVEDVRELWINLKKSHANNPRLVKLADDMSREFELQYENEVATLIKKLIEYKNREYTVEVENELEELVCCIDIPEVPWETGICKVCGLNRDDDFVLLCDTQGCNAEYHTYCLNPPLSEIPEGKWYCPTCSPPNEQTGPRQFLQFEDKTWEEASQFVDIATALEEKEYWELEVDKKILLLKFIFDESLNSDLIRKNLDKSPRKLANKFLGMDSLGKLYWGFPYGSTHHGIVVNGNTALENTKVNPCDHPTTRSQFEDCGTWCLFQSDEEIRSLVNYLTRNDPEKTELIGAIMEHQILILQGRQKVRREPVESEMVYSANLKKPSSNRLATNATSLLEAKYGLDMEPKTAMSLMKQKRKRMAKWHRCDCLEPIFPSRYHCVKCHETFFTHIEFVGHNHSTCGASSSSAMSNVDSGKCRILRQLKINLLDMEAALPHGAKRPSRASTEWRSAWCAFVKHANTVYEMAEATSVLETMIKTKYIKNTWWWYWSSLSVAAKTSTMSALALRIYTLDAAINYQEATTSSSSQKQSRRQKSVEAKEQKETKEKNKKIKVTTREDR